ncbi:MAG TPA: Ig-like domain-containing protein [Trebonia sp.]|nr:Ig-like domain-containing protein [Trebonia sp.]
MSFLGKAGGAGRASAVLLRHRMISATAAAAAAVIVAGGAFAATSAHASGQERLVNTGDSKKIAKSAAAPAKPLRLLSVSPAGGTRHANGGAPITLRFSSALSPATPLPTLSPKIAGSWKVSGETATFTPSSGFLPDTTVRLTIPGGKAGMRGAAGAADVLATASTVTFTTGTYSTLRLQQILAQLGYLPLTWTPRADGAGGAGGSAASLNQEVSAAYDPPAGTFTFKSGYPAQLTSQWHVGQDNMLDQGAVRAFEYNQGLTMDGDAGPQVWARLLAAAAADKVNPSGYTYALASQDSPHESLKVWHNGKLILDTLANTGIAAANTQDGTFPVYERLQFQVMKGTNPDGSKYADPVYWISYFNGGDAVHYFDRASYGYYQSLGCVEIPWTQAKFIWPYLTYGTLVTVTGPVA